MSTAAKGSTHRIYVFDEKDQLHRIGQDLYGDLRFEDGEIGELKNQIVRIAYVSIETVDGKPSEISQVFGERWSMNRYGQPDARTRKLFREYRRQAFHRPDRAASANTDDDVVDLERLFAEKQVQNALSWEPTDHEVTLIIHDVWPETAGKKITHASFLKSSEAKRPPLSFDARHTFDDLWKPILDIKQRFLRLSGKNQRLEL